MPIRSPSKAEGSALCQARTKIGLRAFLHWQKVPEVATPACPCGNGDQTAAHLHGREVSGAASVRVRDKRGSVWQLKPPGHGTRHGSSAGPQQVAAAVQGLQKAAERRYNAGRRRTCLGVPASAPPAGTAPEAGISNVRYRGEPPHEPARLEPPSLSLFLSPP